MKPRRLTAIVACVMLAQASLGLLFHSEYRDVEWIATTWLGNDWVTLLIALPMLTASVRLTSTRGSLRAQLLWLGTLAYAGYNYTYYLFGAALNAFFPLYLAAVIATACALIIALSKISPSSLARRFSSNTPNRLIGGYFVLVGITLAGIWLSMWVAYVFAGRPTPVEPEAFKVVAAVDTVLMAPVLAGGGALLYRHHPWGYVISAMAGVAASLYLLVLSINSVIFVARGLTAAPGEIPLWSSLVVTTSAATSLLFAHAAGRLEV